MTFQGWRLPDDVALQIGRFVGFEAASAQSSLRPIGRASGGRAASTRNRAILVHGLRASKRFSWADVLGREVEIRLLHRSQEAVMAKASSSGHSATAVKLLRNGLPPNGTYENGIFLRSAVTNGHVSVVLAVLEAQANPNIAGLFAETVLHTAARHARLCGCWRIHKALLESDADPNAKDMAGKTPMEVAVD